MKKLFFTTGIIVILIGGALAYSYSLSKLLKKEELVASDYDVWELSGQFKVGERIIVNVRYAAKWREGPTDIDDDIPLSHRHIWFEIVDPNGNITEYNTGWAESNPENPSTSQFARCYISVTVRGGGIDAEQYPTYIGGTALLNGTYTARVVKEFYPALPEETPPDWLALAKAYPVVIHPYTYLLPIGILVSAVGAVVSAKAATSKKKRNKIKKT